MAGAFVARALSECRGHEFSDGVYHGDKLVQGKPTKVYLNFKEADHLIDKSADDAGDIWKNVVNASKEAEKSPSRDVPLLELHVKTGFTTENDVLRNCIMYSLRLQHGIEKISCKYCKVKDYTPTLVVAWF